MQDFKLILDCGHYREISAVDGHKPQFVGMPMTCNICNEYAKVMSQTRIGHLAGEHGQTVLTAAASPAEQITKDVAPAMTHGTPDPPKPAGNRFVRWIKGE